jgi:preprotein translocase subunit SecA
MMDHLRDSVTLRAYGEQDPLVEYKREGHQMFQQLLNLFEANVCQLLFKVSVRPQVVPLPSAEAFSHSGGPIQLSRSSNISTPPVQSSQPSHKAKKIGRNQPCPCGSGKKYKKCCLLKEQLKTRQDLI